MEKSYKSEIIRAMQLLAKNEKTLFIGQNVIYSGAVDITGTLGNIPLSKRIEVPVFEDVQMGICNGLALEGYIPVSIFPRMDFLILAMNQLVNHLDKLGELSCGHLQPKVIIRTIVGTKEPLNPGPQHTQDHTEGLRCMLHNIDVVRLEKAEEIVPAYKRALASPRSTVLIELGEKIRGG